MKQKEIPSHNMIVRRFQNICNDIEKLNGQDVRFTYTSHKDDVISAHFKSSEKRYVFSILIEEFVDNTDKQIYNKLLKEIKVS